MGSDNIPIVIQYDNHTVQLKSALDVVPDEAMTIDILYVDDETTLLEIAKLFLEKDGDFKVCVVDSAGLALEALESRKYDAIVSDYLMPDINGIEFLKSLRRSGDRTPFILFTGKGREEVAIEALNSGADYYLSKGGDPKSQFAELRNMIIQSVSLRQAENALQHNMMRYRLLIENVSDVVALVSAEGQFQYLSPSVRKVLGYDPEDLVGTDFIELVHPDDLEAALEKFRRFAAGEEADQPMEVRVKKKQGAWSHLELSGKVALHGNKTASIITARDVTESKLANSKLEQLNRILRAIRGVNELIIKTRDRDDLLQGICEELLKTKGFNDAWIALFDRDGRFAAAHSAGTGIQSQNLMAMLRQGESPHCMSEALERRDTVLSYEGSDACTDCPAGNMYPGKIILTSGFESDDGNYGVLSVSLPSSLAIEEEKALVKEVADDIAFALSGIELEAERRRMEDSLRESETFFSKAFSANPLPVSITSVETGRIIKANHSFSRIFGYGCEELVGRSALELGIWIFPEDRRKFVGRLKERGSVEGMPFDIRTKCGESIKALIFAEPFEFKGESCILSTIIDLTQRNEMEKMLEKSTRSYKELTDSIGDVFFAMDKDLRYTYWNKASERLTGIKADYAIGRSLFEIFPENEESNATKAYKKALATGTEQTFLNEYRIKDKDYFFEVTAYPSERGLSVFVKDVTERMRAGTELALSESRYRGLFDCMSSGVAVYEARDNGTCFVFKDINIAAQNIENVRKEKITGRCVSEVFPGVKEFGLFDVFKRVWETGVPEHFNAAMYKDDRISGWRENFVYRLPSGEIVAVYEDVTDRITTEKTKEAVFDISEATSSTIDIQDLYVRIHRILEGLMPVRNVFIALHDALTDTLSFPYFVDEHDPTPAPRKAGRGLAEYVLRTGRPLLASAQDVRELSDRGEIDIIGTIPVCWVGVPLLIEGRTIGVIVIQSYDEEFEYVERDRDVLYYVSNEVAMAIERKNSEKALKESEEKYRNLVEKANDGITIIQDGVIRYTNPKLAEMGGYTIEETIGKPFMDFIWPEDAPKVADLYKRRMRGEKVPSIYEARLRGKGGECLYVELNTTVIEYVGRPADFAIVRDLTYKIEAQEALRQSEQKYRGVFENTGTAMVMIEEDMTISLMNEEFEKLTGYSKKEVEGKMKSTDFVTEESLQKIKDYHRLRIVTPDAAPKRYEIQVKDRNGNIKDIFLTIDVLSGTKRSVVSLLDITDLKKAEEDREKAVSLLTATLESAADGILVVDRQGRTVRFNRRFLELWQISESLASKVSDERLEIIKHQLKDPERFTTKVMELLQVSPDTESFDVLEFKDGRIFERYSRPQRIGNEVVGRVWSFRDVSERKRLEDEMRQSEVRYRTMFENTGTATIMIEDDMTISLANNEFEGLSGFSKEEIEGEIKWTRFASERDLSRMAEYHRLRRIDPKAAPRRFEFKFVGRTREPRDVSVTVDMIPGTKQSIASFRDITEQKKAQSMLQKEKEDQELLLDNIETMVWYATDPETYGAVNRARAEFIGKTKEELENKKIWEILPTQEAKIALMGNRIAFEEKRTYRGDEWITTARGEKRLVTVTKIPKLDADGNVQFVVCTGHDITDRKLAEDALRQSDERFQLVNRAMFNVIWDWDLQTDALWWNENFQTLFGYRTEEIEETVESWTNRIHPEDLDRVTRSIHTAIDSGRQSWSDQYRFRRKDDTYAEIEDRGHIVREANGKPVRMIGAMQDITESKMLEKELHDKSNEQALLLDNIQTMVYFATDPETHGKTNQARADFLGKRIEEIEGMKIRELMPKDSAEVAIAGNRYVFETKKPYHGLEWLTNWKGERRLFSVTKVPKLDEKGNVEFSICSAHDVTDLEETRSALSLANKKLNLLGNVTRHDILNQLTVISGGLDMAEGIVKEDKARRYMDMAMNASRSIEKYLEFSRDYEKMGTAKPEWIEVREACAKGVSTLETGDANLIVELDGIEIYADKLLEKVFHNLIGNALKHGGKVSTVRIHSRREDGHMVLVCEDDGNGIPEDKKKSILEGRLGRGLYLVKEILAITGMTVEETGVEGRGARFEIRVPNDKYRMMMSPSNE
jgi:PAS domain S-box-containing protein